MREIGELLPSFSGGFAILMRAKSPDLAESVVDCVVHFILPELSS